MKDQMVEVIKSPEAPYLVGKRGIVSHKQGNWFCVKIGDTFTHFRKDQIKVVKTP